MQTNKSAGVARGSGYPPLNIWLNQALIDAASGATIIVPSGSWEITAPIVVPAGKQNITITTQGSIVSLASTFDTSNVMLRIGASLPWGAAADHSESSGRCFNGLTKYACTAAVTPGATTLTLGTGLSVADGWYALIGDGYCTHEDGVTVAPIQGELVYLSGYVSGTGLVNVTQKSGRPYTHETGYTYPWTAVTGVSQSIALAQNPRVYLVTARVTQNIVFNGFTFHGLQGSNTLARLVWGCFATGIQFTNCHFNEYTDGGCVLELCSDGRFTNCSVRSQAASGNRYGIALMQSRGFIVSNCAGNGGRRAMYWGYGCYDNLLIDYRHEVTAITGSALDSGHGMGGGRFATIRANVSGAGDIAARSIDNGNTSWRSGSDGILLADITGAGSIDIHGGCTNVLLDNVSSDGVLNIDSPYGAAGYPLVSHPGIITIQNGSIICTDANNPAVKQWGGTDAHAGTVSFINMHIEHTVAGQKTIAFQKAGTGTTWSFDDCDVIAVGSTVPMQFYAGTHTATINNCRFTSGTATKAIVCDGTSAGTVTVTGSSFTTGGSSPQILYTETPANWTGNEAGTQYPVPG